MKRSFAAKAAVVAIFGATFICSVRQSPPAATGDLTMSLTSSTIVDGTGQTITAKVYNKGTDPHSVLMEAENSTVNGRAYDGGTVAAKKSLSFRYASYGVGVPRIQYGQIGLSYAGPLETFGTNLVETVPMPADLPETKQLAVGGSHAAALGSDGVVRCWGSDLFGEADVPADLGAGSQIANVFAGPNNSAALTYTGNLTIWGLNDSGQADVPASVQGHVAWAAIGHRHTVVALEDGSVAAWGADVAGETSTPSLSNVTQTAAGDAFSAALDSTGHVTVWGQNWFGLSMPSIGGAAQIAAGLHHLVVLGRDGSVSCYGPNVVGENNVPDFGGHKAVSVAAGPFGSAAILDDGTLLTWGQIPAADASLGPVSQVGLGAGFGIVQHEPIRISKTIKIMPFMAAITCPTQVVGSYTLPFTITVNGAPVDGPKTIHLHCSKANQFGGDTDLIVPVGAIQTSAILPTSKVTAKITVTLTASFGQQKLYKKVTIVPIGTP